MSLPISDDRSSDNSVMIGPDVLNGCVLKFGIGGGGGGGCTCVPGKTVTTLIIFDVVVVLSDGIMCASDGLLFRAIVKK